MHMYRTHAHTYNIVVKGEGVGCGGVKWERARIERKQKVERERDGIFCLFGPYDGLITHLYYDGRSGIRNWVGHSGGNFSTSWDHCRGIS